MSVRAALTNSLVSCNIAIGESSRDPDYNRLLAAAGGGGPSSQKNNPQSKCPLKLSTLFKIDIKSLFLHSM